MGLWQISQGNFSHLLASLWYPHLAPALAMNAYTTFEPSGLRTTNPGIVGVLAASLALRRPGFASLII